MNFRWLGSLTGRTALLMAGAILVAQVSASYVLLSERQRTLLFEGSSGTLVAFSERVRGAASQKEQPGPGGPGPSRSWVPGEFWISDFSVIDLRGLRTDSELSRRLEQSLREVGVKPLRAQAMRLTSRDAREPMAPPPMQVRLSQPPQDSGEKRTPFAPPEHGDPGPRSQAGGPQGPGPMAMQQGGPMGGFQDGRPSMNAHMFDEYVFATEISPGVWANARLISPSRGDFVGRLALATALIYVVVLGAALLLVNRLAEPFRQLAAAAADVGAEGAPRLMRVHGPTDVRDAMTAFNAMATRVSQLLSDNDRMLGAIGHDLRTPLVAMRVRVESVEPQSERDRLIECIDDMRIMLDEILELSRKGQSAEPYRLVDLSALVDVLTEEYREQGLDVQMLESPMAPVFCRSSQLRRLVRNLVDNAIKYGERARLSVDQDSTIVRVIVDDDGPGMPANEMDRVFEPFYRLERSRNRMTGGIGLGLSIAKAIATAHQGDMKILNRPEGGTRIIFSMPRPDMDSAATRQERRRTEAPVV